MLALVKTQKGIGHLELKEVPKPFPGLGEVLIEVRACGVCGTDIHVMHDRFPYWPPVVLGHEFAGVVVQLGPGVERSKEGDRVVGEPHTQHCGHCYLCRTGNVQICPMKRSPGWGIDGGFAKYLKMPEKLLHNIPDALSFETAAVVEPTANTVSHIVERATVTAGDLCVVLGPGPIGLLAALTCRAAGARHIVIIGTPKDEDMRLKKARELGIDSVVNLAEQNPIELVRELSGGAGADLVVEASGSEPGIQMAVDLVRKKGRICAIGLHGDEAVKFPWDKAMFKVCDLYFNLSTNYTSWDRTIALVASGKIPAGEIISHREPLRNWRSVFDDIENLKALKAVLIP